MPEMNPRELFALAKQTRDKSYTIVLRVKGFILNASEYLKKDGVKGYNYQIVSKDLGLAIPFGSSFPRTVGQEAEVLINMSIVNPFEVMSGSRPSGGGK